MLQQQQGARRDIFGLTKRLVRGHAGASRKTLQDHNGVPMLAGLPWCGKMQLLNEPAGGLRGLTRVIGGEIAGRSSGRLESIETERPPAPLSKVAEFRRAE